MRTRVSVTGGGAAAACAACTRAMYADALRIEGYFKPLICQIKDLL